MKITGKGQITIPANLRDEYGLLPNCEVEWVRRKEGLILKKTKRSHRRGNRLVMHMAGTATVKLKTDEIMRLTRGDND